METGIRLLELTRNMHRLFVPTWRQPFDMIAVAKESNEASKLLAGPENGLNQNWLPGMDSNHDSRLQRPLSYH